MIYYDPLVYNFPTKFMTPSICYAPPPPVYYGFNSMCFAILIFFDKILERYSCFKMVIRITYITYIRHF